MKKTNNAAKTAQKSGKSVSAKTPVKTEYEKRWFDSKYGKATITVDEDGQAYLNLRRIPIATDIASANGKSMLLASSRGNLVLQEEGSTSKKRVPIMYDAEDWQSEITVSFNCFAVIPKEFRAGRSSSEAEEEE